MNNSIISFKCLRSVSFFLQSLNMVISWFLWKKRPSHKSLYNFRAIIQSCHALFDVHVFTDLDDENKKIEKNISKPFVVLKVKMPNGLFLVNYSVWTISVNSIVKIVQSVIQNRKIVCSLSMRTRTRTRTIKMSERQRKNNKIYVALCSTFLSYLNFLLRSMNTHFNEYISRAQNDNAPCVAFTSKNNMYCTYIHGKTHKMNI